MAFKKELDAYKELNHKSNNYLITESHIMDNRGVNPYPDVSNQPFIANQAPPPPRQQNPYNQLPPGGYNQGFANQGYAPNQGNQGFVPAPNPYQNQGFQPNNNQGFSPNTGRLACPFCRRETENFPKKAPGGVTWIWCFALFLFTGICCCIPFCVDSCQDTLMVCVVCQGVKGRIEANCC